MTADFDPLAPCRLAACQGVPNNLPSQPGPVVYPDLDEYREASFQHAESHVAAATDPELCDSNDCPHWPSWWTSKP